MNDRSRPVVLITGAAKRVGAVIARALFDAGYDLALHYRHSRQEMMALCAELDAKRENGTHRIQADLADVTGLPRLIEDCLARFGRLDALINNASAFFATPIGDTTAAQWDELFASNARAPFFLSQAAAEPLRRSHGSIVNLLDIYAERPLPHHTVYCMAKAALAMMTKALAIELAPEVRVNAIAPGAVLWPEIGKPQAAQDRLIARTPLKRSGTPEDVAAAVRFLLDEARFTTGAILTVDGGRSITL